MEQMPKQDNLKLSFEQSKQDCAAVREQTQKFVELFKGVEPDKDGNFPNIPKESPRAAMQLVHTFIQATESYFFRNLKNDLEKTLKNNPSQKEISLAFGAMNHFRPLQKLLWDFEQYSDVFFDDLEVMRHAVEDGELFTEKQNTTFVIVCTQAKKIHEEIIVLEKYLKQLTA